MGVVGLITEYNPFHNGHKYHINMAKEKCGADYAVVVMSGNFVQRGTPAIIDKYERTKMALDNGADLVFELPACYATASANYFSHGAVSILDKLGIVDHLCFGSESGDIKEINIINKIISNYSPQINFNILHHMKQGISYPLARERAIKDILNHIKNKDLMHHDLNALINNFIYLPNNILSLEYMMALNTFKSEMIPITIKRKAAHYHDPKINLSNSNELAISSATAIRNVIDEINSDTNFKNIRNSVPASVYDILTQKYKSKYPIIMDDFGQIIKYKLQSESSNSLTRYFDMNSDLAARIKNNTNFTYNLSDIIMNIKSKNITLTRIHRVLIHVLLNIYNEDMVEYMKSGYTPYARLLGMKKESSGLLRKIEKSEKIPVITKVSNAYKQLDDVGMRMLHTDIFASHIYNQIVYDKYQTKILSEYQHGIVIQ